MHSGARYPAGPPGDRTFRPAVHAVYASGSQTDRSYRNLHAPAWPGRSRPMNAVKPARPPVDAYPPGMHTSCALAVMPAGVAAVLCIRAADHVYARIAGPAEGATERRSGSGGGAPPPPVPCNGLPVRKKTREEKIQARDERDARAEAAAKNLLHTFACEKGELTMVGLWMSMRRDAQNQEGIPGRLGSALDKTVPFRMVRLPELAQFEGPRRCALPPSAFLNRMLRYGQASPCCMVVAMKYLERINARLPAACLTALNMQRLLLTLVMIASKYLDDYFCSNKQWAAIGDLPTPELNRLELDVLTLMDFKLNITREEYDCTNSVLELIDKRTASRPSTTAAASMQQATAQEIAARIKVAVEEAQAKAEEVSSMRSSAGDSIPKGPSPRQGDVPASQQYAQQSRHSNYHVQLQPQHISKCESTSRETAREPVPPSAIEISTSRDVELSATLSSTQFGMSHLEWSKIPRPLPSYYDIPTSPTVAPNQSARQPGEARRLQGDATVDAQEDFYDIPVVTAMPLATPTARPQRSAAVAERSQSTPTRNDLARSQYLSSFVNRANRENEARIQRQPSAPLAPSPAPPPRLHEHQSGTPRRALQPAPRAANVSPWHHQAPKSYKGVLTPRTSEIPTHASTPSQEYPAPCNTPSRPAASPYAGVSPWMASPSISVPHQRAFTSAIPGTPSRSAVHPSVGARTPVRFLQMN